MTNCDNMIMPGHNHFNVKGGSVTLDAMGIVLVLS